MNLKIILITLFISITSLLLAQEQVEIVKKEFKTSSKSGLKEAWKAIKKAREPYSFGGEYYKDALQELLKATKYNDANPELNYKIGVCYYKTGNYGEAVSFFQKSFETKNNVSGDIHFLIARCLHMQSEFEKAAGEYRLHQMSLSPKQLKKNRGIFDKYVNECKNGMELQKSKNNIYIENLGDEVNSSYPDYFPVLTNDESKMYYTSRRPGEKNDKYNKYDNLFFENIYEATNMEDEWKNVKNLGKLLDPGENQVAIETSLDDNYLYIYKGKENGGDFYETYMHKGKWKNPRPVTIPLNTKYKESSLCIAPDNQTIYFVSDRGKGGHGGKDIYAIKKKNDKKWNKPVNAGNTVNTPYDEEGVFVSEDGSTIYFSSKGHNSVGGFDVYKSTINPNGVLSRPENMGIPINTPGDDVFFSITKEGRYAYYSSSGHSEGLGDKDIYMIIFMGPEKEMISNSETDKIAVLLNPLKLELLIEAEDSTTNVTILKGTIKDADSLNPIFAKIEIIDNETNELIFSSSSDSITGEFFVTLPAGANYGISAAAEGYLYHSEYIDIPLSAKYEEIDKDILLKAVEIGEKLVLKNIFFETNKATLQAESYVELGFALKMLKENETLRFEISGHTDNVGSHQSNMKLSEERAKSVVNFLVGSGIDPGRLEYKGYGFTEPIASNDTEEGRKQNRRVEFKILGEKEE